MAERLRAIRYPFAIDSGHRRLAQEPDYAEHVAQMMRQVLLTNPGERINRPDFGCGIRRMVFAPNTDTSAAMTEITVRQALDRWLGDVIEVDKVEVAAREEKLAVRIRYSLRARTGSRFLDVEVGP